ncbi:hypothetical protein Bra3105_17310 [Brachybacterium halotolerans subsp. kimchii]|uniref:hypothetical protein n=1 Tax=Brachybacterium halotolerans TaxID=2795215 RepID=UPI001E653A33|nr:hypothetical protein [Brachybacterium halotolerans]UEJ82564.1 hypothetical protein Bra3105_17310 [Brachybacterium halotolerans subsp. kimchii]
MAALERCTAQAEQLVRWHREGNRPVGGRIRRLPGYAELNDLDVLARPFTRVEAQEVIALEAGCVSWDELAVRVDPLFSRALLQRRCVRRRRRRPL